MMPVTQQFGPGTTGAQNPISLDYMPLSKITAAVNLIAAGTYTIEVTLDDVFDQDNPGYVPAASASWFTQGVAGATVDGYVTFDGPWRAVRLNIAANGTGIIFTVGQAVTPRA